MRRLPPVPPPEALLCEACGYVLSADGQTPPPPACPECGEPAANSQPARRDGPPWARRMSPGSFARTVWGLARGPTRFFGRLRPDADALPPRLFLLTVATLVGCGWAAAERWLLGRPPVLALGFGMAAGHAVIALTFLEVLGVTLFSRLRGWRVPARLAEKVACYASPGWLLGAAAALGAEAVALEGGLGRTLARLTGDPLLGVRLEPAAIALTALLAVLPFELCVHRGVRAVRFANGRSQEPARGATAP